MANHRILVVEDEPAIAQAIAERLRAEGFDAATAPDGPAAADGFGRWAPDLVVLDIMLPGFDGLEVCRRIQAERPMPVLTLTARSDEVDQLIGMGIGADDHLTKPFSMRVLVARVRALLRRVERAAGEPRRVLRLGGPGGGRRRPPRPPGRRRGAPDADGVRAARLPGPALPGTVSLWRRSPRPPERHAAHACSPWGRSPRPPERHAAHAWFSRAQLLERIWGWADGAGTRSWWRSTSPMPGRSWRCRPTATGRTRSWRTCWTTRRGTAAASSRSPPVRSVPRWCWRSPTARASPRPSGTGCSSGSPGGGSYGADGGTGLGLAIARWAVELHGGRIAVVDSDRGCRIRAVPPD